MLGSKKSSYNKEQEVKHSNGNGYYTTLFLFPTSMRDFVTKNGRRKRKKLEVYTVEKILILLLSIIFQVYCPKDCRNTKLYKLLHIKITTLSKHHCKFFQCKIIHKQKHLKVVKQLVMHLEACWCDKLQDECNLAGIH